MSDPLHIAEDVVAGAGGVSWLKLAVYGLGIAALLGVGWAAHGAFDGTKAAKAETSVAKCEAGSERQRADVNGAAAADLGLGGKKAAAADRNTGATENPRKAGYAAAQQEASHVPQSPTPAVCIDPEPLRQLFIGMRDADRKAEGGNRDGGGASPAAELRLSRPAVPF